MNHQIEFVYFDLGNVLVRFDPNIACNNLLERFGVRKQQSWEAIYNSGFQDRFEHGQYSGEEFAEQIRQSLGVNAERMPTAGLLDAVSDMFTPIDVMAEVLHRVRENGFGVGLLSNTCHAHWDWIRRQSYFMNQFRFDATVLSFEEGVMKPDSVIYEIAEERVGVPAESIFFLDDKPENINAARSRCWQANCCLGGEAAIKVLQDFRILGEQGLDR
ncbi:MAG: HAD family hydrolase [Rubripirellula sp.]|jgi:epoxide hydrolase-like predicted phosphatase